MADPAVLLTQRTDALREITVRIPGGIAGLTCAQDADVVDLVVAAQQIVVAAQGVLAAAAGEVARRSASGGEASLARRLGEKTARQLVANRGRMTFGDAVRAIKVGEAIRPNVALSGEDLPADRVHIAEAVLQGRLSLGLAEVIDETLTSVAHRVLLDEQDQLEASLVKAATSGAFSVPDFIAYCRRIPNLLDPDGAEPRDKHLRDQASIHETRLSNGMLRIVADLDPERAAYYLAAMRARTNPRRQSDAGNDPDGTDSNVTDLHGRRDRAQPTPAQSKLDAFISVLRDAVKTDNGAQAGVDTTVLVRIDLQDLLTGLGTATIDGIGEPISAATARRMAADADLIPQVFDGNSVLLDQGQSKRTFTRAQRYAILAMFVGCALTKCGVPSSMVEFHHIGQWATRHQHDHGTDLLNGIPLCGFHNRLMETGWQIDFDDDRVPWFTPPATVDPSRRPVRGANLADQRAA